MLASVSVDLDPISCYYRIHALGPAPADLVDVIWTRAVPRYLEVLARARVRATFFVVTSDLEHRAARVGVAQMLAAGHEIGSHSHVHAYDLGRWGLGEAREEITRAHQELAAIGATPVGFRAPGYDLSPAMLQVLCELGYRYDSSIFPAPGYYAAKAAVMTGLALARRPSGAVLTEPRALLAPVDPYQPAIGAPWKRGSAPIRELPVCVSRWARLPLIGTNLLLAPPWLSRKLIAGLGHRPHFNFELHGIDLIDAEADGMPGELVGRQPDLRRPLAQKLAALETILGETERVWAPLAEV